LELILSYIITPPEDVNLNLLPISIDFMCCAEKDKAPLQAPYPPESAAIY
jgi:hypothetical protein